ncbi:MAG: glycosyltransferase family 2 protein [Fusobacteriaceae bacterium]
MKLSVAIMTFNEEKNLARTLKSIEKLADEIIIVDSGSTDSTQQIAESFNVKFFTESWKGYGMQRNSSLEKCSGEWILNIDADEEVSDELFNEIKNIINKIDANEKIQKTVYEINRSSICFGKKLNHGGWSGSYAVRLFKNGSGKFNTNLVHEQFETTFQIYKIKKEIFHHSYNELQDYFQRFNRYTTEGALDYYKKNKKFSIFQITFNPFYKFIRMYFFRLGFLDGIEGFVIAITSSLYTLVKYFKLREIYKNGSYLKDK